MVWCGGGKTHALQLLKQPPSKEKFKSDAKQKIVDY